MTTHTETFKGHTPGPLFHQGNCKVVRKDKRVVADFSRSTSVAIPVTERLKNADLCAAAPTLLSERDALKAMLRKLVEEFSEWDRPEEDAKSAAGHYRNRRVRLYEEARKLAGLEGGE